VVNKNALELLRSATRGDNSGTGEGGEGQEGMEDFLNTLRNRWDYSASDLLEDPDRAQLPATVKEADGAKTEPETINPDYLSPDLEAAANNLRRQLDAWWSERLQQLQDYNQERDDAFSRSTGTASHSSVAGRGRGRGRGRLRGSWQRGRGAGGTGSSIPASRFTATEFPYRVIGSFPE
jgi:hypothetical protein